MASGSGKKIKYGKRTKARVVRQRIDPVFGGHIPTDTPF